MSAEGPRRYSTSLNGSSEMSATSGMFSMIPNAVRSRIARSSRIPILNPWSRPQNISTPPPERSRSSSTSSGCTEDVETIGMGAMSSRYPSTPRPGSPTAGADAQALVPAEGNTQTTGPSSIDWDMADVGYRISAAARQQAYARPADTIAVRRLHIDAINYLVMALPPDLTATEVERLRENMPQVVLDGNSSTAPTSTSKIRRLTAWLTALLVSWVLCFLPLLMVAFTSILQFARQHQVTERGWGFLQGVYLGLTTFLVGNNLDMPACGYALGRAMGGLVLWLASLLSDLARGMEEGWDRAALGQGRAPDGSVELLQARAQRRR